MATSPPLSSCPAAAGKPVFCLPAEGGQFVVGLPRGHGWERGDWVLLSQAQPGLTVARPVAIAVLVEALADVARVMVLHQTDARLDGAGARKIGKEERPQLGKHVGRVLRGDGGRVQLGVGKADGAVEGDVYTVRSARDANEIVGRVQVKELGELHAWAVALDGDPAREGQPVVYLRAADAGVLGAGAPVSILVVNFDPADEQDTREAKAGRGFAKQLANELGNAAAGLEGLTVRYEGSQRVRVDRSDEEGHAEARAIGKRFGAHIVVWGSMRCDKMGCALPRFTVVDPERLERAAYRGNEVWGSFDDAGFTLKGARPVEPVALAAAILGSVAYDAQRYADARVYLGKALSQGVLQGEDELRGRKSLAHALYTQGQTVAAREQASVLTRRARTAGAARWEHLGRAELALIDVREGKVDAARVHLGALRQWAEATGNDGGLAFALNEFASLDAQQGRVDEARKQLEKSLELSRRIGDVQAQAATLHALAVLGAQQGRVEEARKQLEKSLELKRRIGDVQGDAATLHLLAVLDAQQGRVEEARQQYEKSLELSRRIGDVQSEAMTLHALAVLGAQQGRVDEARQQYEKSLELSRRIGGVHGEAATLNALAALEAQQGRVDEARQQLEKSLELRRRIGDAPGEAATLHNLAALEAQQGRVDQARKQYEKSLELKRRIGDVQGELATRINMAVLDFRAGQRDEARQRLEETLERARVRRYAEYEAQCLSWLGIFDRVEGKHASARARLTAAIALYRVLQMSREEKELEEQLASLPP
ncbi:MULTISPECIES: lipopolysaccharide assembly protein LapB [Sorangium]|uniref:tetratricopeptide repeat protein n=1 Tax=Sorangium TaxID=39643 RepID=UPI001A919015|nr:MULTISPECIES: tetratricopeptide repeat protein [Sorangium]